MNDLVCPVCLTEGRSADYPGEKLFCWNCMCEQRGRVYIVRKDELAVPEAVPERPKKVRKSA